MRFNAMALHGAAFAVALLTASAARAENTPLGLWIDHTGRGAVEIKECNGQKLCGNIVWLKDSKNNEACGRQVIGDAKPVGGGKWDNGWIYDPDSESKYDVELTPLGDKLRVVGYAGSKWLSETMTWTRAPADLQRCAKDAAAAASPEKQTAEKQPDAKSATADARQAAATPPAPIASPDDKADTKADTKAEAKPADKPANDARAGSKLDPSDAPSDKSADAGDDSDDGASDRPRRKGEALKKITQALNLRKLKDGRCKMDVPFVDMQVTFDCEQ